MHGGCLAREAQTACALVVWLYHNASKNLAHLPLCYHLLQWGSSNLSETSSFLSVKQGNTPVLLSVLLLTLLLHPDTSTCSRSDTYMYI